MKKLALASSLAVILSGCYGESNEFYVQTCNDKSIGPDLRIIIKDKTVAVFNDRDTITMEYIEFDNCKVVNLKNWSCYQPDKVLKEAVESIGDKYDAEFDIKVLWMQNGFMFIDTKRLQPDGFRVFENAELGFSGWRYWSYKIGLGLPTLPFAMCSK